VFIFIFKVYFNIKFRSLGAHVLTRIGYICGGDAEVGRLIKIIWALVTGPNPWKKIKLRMLIGIASKSHPISLAMAYSYIIIEKMKNPFLSNDNIFEKLPKKSPAGRRDRTPPKLHDS
jgi:hypothetical protein